MIRKRCQYGLMMCAAGSALLSSAGFGQTPAVTTDVAVSDAIRPAVPGAEEAPPRWGGSKPLDPALYKPEPLPRAPKRLVPQTPTPVRPAGARVSLDLRTGVETRETASPLASSGLGEGSRPGRPGAECGLWPVGDGGVAPLNFGALTLVADPTSGRYPTAVKLFFTKAGAGKVASGTLIDATHVLTAGHCVHEGNGGNWVTDMVVIPAYGNGNEPYGRANGIQLHSWTGWTEDGDWDHDVGLIDLDRPVGFLTGWRGYGYYNDRDSFTSVSWVHNGYPAESPYNGLYMYTITGHFDSCDTFLGIWYGNEVTYEGRSYGGQSGSGAVRDDVVRAVLSNGDNDSTDDTRLTEDKVGDIDNWIDADTPASVDLVPLDVQVSPTGISSGEQIASLSYLIANHSSASWTGTAVVEVYLSTNDNISTSDTLLQTRGFTGTIGPNGHVRITSSSSMPRIPPGTTAGTYWIGAILDVTDANTGNNDTDGWDAAEVTITCPGMWPPTLVVATDGSYTDRVRVTWNAAENADSYEVWRNTTSNSGTATRIASSVAGTVYDDLTATPGITYYYWVKSKIDCGNVSGFSLTASGWRALLAPTDVTATDGTYTDFVVVTWDTVTGASFYRVYRNTTNDLATATALGMWQAGTTYGDGSATPGITHFYWVKAATTSDGTRPSGFSLPASGWRALAPPTGVSATDGTYTGYVRVTWNTVEGASHYRVYRNTTNNPATATPMGPLQWQSGTTYDDASATPGTTYYYWAKAATSSGGHHASDFSAGNSGWRALSAPSEVKATDGTLTTGVRVLWNTVEGASHYRAYRNTTHDPATATALGDWQAGTAYEDTSATPGATYYYWVKAATSSSGARASAFSAPDSGWRALSVPVGVWASDGIFGSCVRVTWLPAAGAGTYRVYRNTADDPGTAVAISTWQAATSFDDIGAVPGITCFYWVRAAVDPAGSRATGLSSPDTGWRAPPWSTDLDGDSDVDVDDFAMFQVCFNGPGSAPPSPPTCTVDADFDNDGDVDLNDFAVFQTCFNGASRPPACP